MPRDGTTAAVILFAAITMYAIFGGADFGAGFWDLVAGGAKRGERPREVIDHSIAPVWEANHVWLIFVFVLLWTCFPEAYASITLTLFVPLTLAALGIVLAGRQLRVPQGGVPHPRPTQLRRRLRAVVGPGALLLRRRRRRHRLGAGPGRGQGGRPVGQLGQPDLRPRGRARRVPDAYLAAFFLVRDAGRLSDEAMVAYFRRRATGAAVVAGRCRWPGSSCCPTTRSTSSTGSPRGPCHWSSCRRSAAWAPRAARPRSPARSPAGRRGRGGQRRPGVGRGAVGLPAARVADGLGRRRRRRAPSPRCWWPPDSRWC